MSAVLSRAGWEAALAELATPAAWVDHRDVPWVPLTRVGLHKDSLASASSEVEVIWRRLGLHAGSRVLDLGCGTGRHLLRLRSLGAEIFGVDSSPRLCAVARHLLADPSDIRCQDIRRPWTGPRVDAVLLLTETFGIGGDRDWDRDVLANARAALAPTGAIVIQVPDRERLPCASRVEHVWEDPAGVYIARETVDYQANFAVRRYHLRFGSTVVALRLRQTLYTATELLALAALTNLEVTEMGHVDDTLAPSPSSEDLLVVLRRPR